MSVCQLRPLPLQEHIEGLSRDKFAIVPDIQSYSFGSDLQGSKRYRSDSDTSFGEEELDLLGQEQLDSYSFQEPKRHCSGYSISSSPDQFRLVENTTTSALCSEVFSPQVNKTYNFGAGKDSSIFTCGGNSPVSSASSSPSATNFAATRTQASGACQQIVDFQSLVPIEFPLDMQRQSQAVLSQLSQQHTEKYELVITEQPEEVRWFVHYITTAIEYVYILLGTTIHTQCAM